MELVCQQLLSTTVTRFAQFATSIYRVWETSAASSSPRSRKEKMNHESRVNAVSDKSETIANVGANDIFDRLGNHEKLLTVKELAGILSISQRPGT